MTHLDRRTLLGTLALAGAAATSVQAQPGMKALSDLKKEAEVACVYHCDYGDAARFAQTLTNIGNHYAAYGSNPFDLQIVLVAHSGGVKFFLDNLQGTSWSTETTDPQMFSRIEALAKTGLRVHLCRMTFERQKLDPAKARTNDFTSFVPSGVATVAALQAKGFAYMKIG